MTALDEDRSDWLAWRREGIGGSDVAGILGLSNWSSPWAVWADKMGLLPDQSSPRLRIGQVLEGAIGELFTEATGLHVVGQQTQCEHPRHRWARCTVDGFVTEYPDPALGCPSMRLGGFEAKTDGGAPWAEVPAHYQAQAQWCMLVTGLRHWWFGVLFGRFQFRVYELPYSPSDARLIAHAAARFWHRHIITGQAPPTDGSDATTRALAAAYPDHEPGTSVDLQPSTVWAWRDAAAEATAAKKRADEARNVLCEQLGTAEVGLVDGAPAVTYRTQHRAAYTTQPTSYRVLRQASKKAK